MPVPCASLIEPVREPVTEFAAHARSAWARLIRKVYEADPLECPKCHGPMRILALVWPVRSRRPAQTAAGETQRRPLYPWAELLRFIARYRRYVSHFAQQLFKVLARAFCRLAFEVINR